MQVEIRSNTWEEFPNLKSVNARAQNRFYGDSDIDRFRIIFDPDRSLAAFEDGNIVGCTTSYGLDMMVPGGTMPIGAVAQVSVQATHRRKGINTRLMKRQLSDIHEIWGESMAVLQASESIIYGRYGYGMGSFEYTLEIDRPHGEFTQRHSPAGRLLFIDEDEAKQIFPDVFERATLLRNGMVKRDDTWWKFRFLAPAMMGGDSRAWFVKYEVDGRVDGYLWFTVKDEVLIVKELISATDDAYASLWQFCLDMDLVTTISAAKRAQDEALLWMLADPRRLKQTFKDASWFRLVDICPALSARSYSVEDQLVLKVVDPFLEWNNVNVILNGGPDGTECRKTDKEPDLIVSAADLGAAFIGGVKFRTMSHAGRIEENTSGALKRADAMFNTDRMPWCIDSW